MAREAVCAVCSTVFTARRKDQRTCGKSCWRQLYTEEQPSKSRQSVNSKPGREVAHRRRHAEELMHNDRKAVQLHFAGADIAEIQRALGYDSWGGAQAALQRGMAVYRRFMDENDPADMRAFEIARCDWEIRQTISAILRPGPRVDVKGKPIVDPETGEVVPDYEIKLKALQVYDKIATRVAALKGVQPEKQPAVAVVPVQHVYHGVAVEELR